MCMRRCSVTGDGRWQEDIIVKQLSKRDIEGLPGSMPNPATPHTRWSPMTSAGPTPNPLSAAPSYLIWEPSTC